MEAISQSIRVALRLLGTPDGADSNYCGPQGKTVEAHRWREKALTLGLWAWASNKVLRPTDQRRFTHDILKQVPYGSSLALECLSSDDAQSADNGWQRKARAICVS